MDLITRLKSYVFHAYQPSKAEGFTFKNPYQQQFPFPFDMMKHITLNPLTPKVWEKLTQTCKYFYSKNPVVQIKECKSYLETLASSKTLGDKKWLKIKDLSFKIWLIDKLYLFVNGANDASLELAFIPKIYKCELTMLWVDQQLLFNEFKLLTNSKSLKKLWLIGMTVIKNGRIICVEEIIENVSNVESLGYVICDKNSTTVTSNTATNLTKTLPLTNMKYLGFENLAENFDFENFFDFMMKQHKTAFYLSFSSNVPVAYSNRLQEAVNKIVASKKIPYPLHGICFGEYPRENALHSHYDSFLKRCKHFYMQYKYDKKLFDKYNLDIFVEGF